MKRSFQLMIAAASTSFFISCGGEGDSNQAGNDTGADTTSTNVVNEPVTADTTNTDLVDTTIVEQVDTAMLDSTPMPEEATATTEGGH